MGAVAGGVLVGDEAEPAFTSKDPTDRAAFDAHWARIRASDAVLRTVVADGAVVGHTAVYGPPEEREVTPVIDRAHWGRGIATPALRALLDTVPVRPLRARSPAGSTPQGSVSAVRRREIVVRQDVARA